MVHVNALRSVSQLNKKHSIKNAASERRKMRAGLREVVYLGKGARILGMVSRLSHRILSIMIC